MPCCTRNPNFFRVSPYQFVDLSSWRLVIKYLRLFWFGDMLFFKANRNPILGFCYIYVFVVQVTICWLVWLVYDGIYECYLVCIASGLMRAVFYFIFGLFGAGEAVFNSDSCAGCCVPVASVRLTSLFIIWRYYGAIMVDFTFWIRVHLARFVSIGIVTCFVSCGVNRIMYVGWFLEVRGFFYPMYGSFWSAIIN